MTANVLEPRIELIKEEYVLVQAWKKTASYIRYHNWYADTLTLDHIAVNLPQFLAEVAEQLKAPDQWVNNPLRIVPAPKSQQWHVIQNPAGNKRWEPVSGGKTAAKLRPLAHVSIRDQVAATAVMLCLADRVETLQGSSLEPVEDAGGRKRVISYGNRLFCDNYGSELRHRWGSVKLYRSYYQDYRRFIERPEVVANSVTPRTGERIVIVHSDLVQFYDRVRPALLAQKLHALARPGDDGNFFAFATHLLNWEWDRKDASEVAGYARQAQLSDFTKVALPQGLVSAGFFANVSLLDFDQSMREALDREIKPGIHVEDVCRYVDDLRIVLKVEGQKPTREIEEIVAGWIQGHLDRHAEGLKPSLEKTKAAYIDGDERPLVRQSRKMARIQSAISGGFDAIGGEDILNAVQGLVRSQQRYSERRTEDEDWPFSPIPDVRDATVARFAAGRFRSTYRSLRPLLAATADTQDLIEEDADGGSQGRSDAVRTQADLDDEARAFALGLIENWIEDPSNVRLLRIGLDLWPAQDVLRGVLDLLLPFTESGGRRKAPRRVAWYCLAEILRAGATETGFVEENESLPARVNIAAYRSTLREEAVRLASLPPLRLPWYLRQQAFLFLAASDPNSAPINRTGRSVETKHYQELIRFLRGQGDGMTGADFATLAILARRAFRDQGAGSQLVGAGITARRLEQIAERDPSFALEILLRRPKLSEQISPRLRDDLCLHSSAESNGWVSLSTTVLQGELNGPLRNELAILTFASKFLEEWPTARESEAITPANILLRLASDHRSIENLKVVQSRVTPASSMYRAPDWCVPGERWRFQLGYLLRFVLAARQDFTKVVRAPNWKEGTETYRVPESHWYQRLYGLFNGHPSFGDDWLPISDWVERFLSALLHWPGCRPSEQFQWVHTGITDTRHNIGIRIEQISSMRGKASDVLVLPIDARWPIKPDASRPLRACVIQTVIPTPVDLPPDDLTCSNPTIRKRHRNHLSAALAAIERMLELRETHKGREGRLDWLILPELSVHPNDVKTHLVPFARAHKTIILAGLTYESLFVGKPLVNSALWVIPVWSREYGLQILTRRQGKQHLSPAEEALHQDALTAGALGVQGFRPCQWLVGYEWSKQAENHRPLWLTASICYDATDLSLAADLRHQSDVFAIPALNQDVGTFDQMALALHYHMFQMVIVANNGLYGGSNAYTPYRDSYARQVFHMHGQPQASVAFLEIDDIPAFLQRRTNVKLPPYSSTSTSDKDPSWKFPPAGSWDPARDS